VGLRRGTRSQGFAAAASHRRAEAASAGQSSASGQRRTIPREGGQRAGRTASAPPVPVHLPLRPDHADLAGGDPGGASHVGVGAGGSADDRHTCARDHADSRPDTRSISRVTWAFRWSKGCDGGSSAVGPSPQWARRIRVRFCRRSGAGPLDFHRRLFALRVGGARDGGWLHGFWPPDAGRHLFRATQRGRTHGRQTSPIDGRRAGRRHDAGTGRRRRAGPTSPATA
jgi:hypothetical protein